MKANLASIGRTLEKGLDGMIARADSARAFLERVVYPSYIRAQKKRWMTQGASDGVGKLDAWAPLNPKYAAWKLKRAANEYGGGRKMMILTGQLYKAVVGEGPGHKKLITGKSLVVGVSTPYAKYANAQRDFITFSDQFMDDLRGRYKKMITAKAGL